MAEADPLAALAAKYSGPNYAQDVAAWARHKLGVYLYSLQRDIGNDQSKNVLVRSCHDSGKTFLAAVKACHWLDTHPQRESRVVSTAPTNAQIRGLLWNEINTLYDRAMERYKAGLIDAPLPGEVNQTEWWIGNYQAGVGRKPGDYDQTHMSGWHARHLLVIVDEADGIPADLWGALDTLMTNVGSRLFAIGNPDNAGSYFANMQDKAGTTGDKVYRIRAWDTPNFSGEIEQVPPEFRDILRENLLDPGWVADKRVRWGGYRAAVGYTDAEQVVPVKLTDHVDHSFWSSKVEAEYPVENELVIIKAGDLQACTYPYEVDGVPVHPSGPVSLGVDVAGSEGGDETVIREKIGPFLCREWTIQSGDDAVVSEFIVDKARISGCGRLTIDVTGGFGWGMVRDIRRELPHVAVIQFNFGAGAIDKEHYKNARAELYFYGKELSRDRKWNWAFAENAEDTQAELASVRKVPTTKLLQVESKTDVIKRIGKSPDHADAALLAAWNGSGGGDAAIHSARAATIPTGAAAVVRNGSGLVIPTGAAGVTRR